MAAMEAVTTSCGPRAATALCVVLYALASPGAATRVYPRTLASAAARTAAPRGCLCLIWHASRPAAAPSARASRSPSRVTADACAKRSTVYNQAAGQRME